MQQMWVLGCRKVASSEAAAAQRGFFARLLGSTTGIKESVWGQKLLVASTFMTGLLVIVFLL